MNFTDVIYHQFSLFETSLQNSEELWTITRSIVRIVKQNWRNPTAEYGKARTEQRHFLFSKLCWVAIDRAIKIAVLIKRQDYAEKWSKLQDTVSKDIQAKGWNEEKQAFTQAYGSKTWMLPPADGKFWIH